MDLNYLHHRRQVELLRAAQAAHPKAKEAHLGLATAYTHRIRDERARNAAGWHR
jgi:hypothetical protein